MILFVRMAILSLVTMLVACSGDALLKSSPTSKALPFEEPPQRTGELDEDSVFSMLAAEISSHRGQLDLAQNHYLYVARITGSAYAAKRAARIALFEKDNDKLLSAVDVWVALAPNSLESRRMAAIAYLRAGRVERAYEQLQKLMLVAEAKGKDGYLQIAAAFSKEANPADSLALLQRLVEEKGGSFEGDYAIAVLAFAGQDMTIATSRVVSAYKQRPKEPRVILLYSQVLVQQKKYHEAQELLAEGVKVKPKSTLLRTAYAKVLVEVGDTSAAIEQFKVLLSLQPDDVDIAYAIAVLSIQSKRWDDAELYFKKIYDKGVRRSESAYYLGYIAEQRNLSQQAIAWFESVTDSRFLMDARFRLIQIEADSGELDSALARLQDMHEQYPSKDQDIYMLEVEILRNALQWGKAEILLNSLVKDYPKVIEYRYLRGLIASEAGELKQMEADFNYILQRNPEHVDTLNAYGYTLVDKTDRIQEGANYVAEAYRLEPSNAAILDSMGWAFYRQGKYEKAIKLLRKAFEKFPDGEIAAHLGEVLWVSGEKEKATQLWEQALQNEPNSKHIKDVIQKFE